MKNVLISPRKYVQGRGALSDLGHYLKPLGQKSLILWDSCVKRIVSETVRDALHAVGIQPGHVGDDAERVASLVAPREHPQHVAVAHELNGTPIGSQVIPG